MRRTQLCALALFALWAACDEGEPGLLPDAGPGIVGAPGQSDSAVLVPPGGSLSDAGSPGVGTTPTPPGGALPCNVKTIVDQYCGNCHGAVPQFGAPLPLVSVADFHANAPLAKQSAHLAAIDRVGRTGPGVMPPAGQPALPAAQKSALLDWLRAGAPAGTACTPTQPTGPGDAGSASDAQTPTPDAGAPATTDCDISFELRAYNTQAGTKFPIPAQDDRYECFYFKTNLEPNTLATSLSPLLDETRSLHHWLSNT